ncbi:MAG TPA: type II secretion system protein, partial [Sulfurimonas sp.]|nr:type II secretion system protein [Sulfurimonas sp.]
MMNNFKFLILNFELNHSKFSIQNSALPRSGFSMVELIFVIVLMGILASIGGNLLPDNR